MPFYPLGNFLLRSWFWWVLMSSDGPWWVLMGPDGFWWVSMGPDGSWWALMDPDGFWWVLMGSDEFWWVLMGSDEFRWVLMGPDEFWWILMGFDEFWWVLMGSDGFWWVLMGPDGFWCSSSLYAVLFPEFHITNGMVKGKCRKYRALWWRVQDLSMSAISSRCVDWFSFTFKSDDQIRQKENEFSKNSSLKIKKFFSFKSRESVKYWNE